MASNGQKRVLVRWSDDHDKELLLWIVYCCAESGIKIPFDKIAYYMGPNFSEGAIVQHLAKVRTKMEESGLHCPPTQKRGTVTRAPSKLYQRRKAIPKAPAPRPASSLGEDLGLNEDDDADEYLNRPRGISRSKQGQKSVGRPRRTKKERGIKDEFSGDEIDNLNDNPDGDYVVSSARKRKVRQDISDERHSKSARGNDNGSTAEYRVQNWQTGNRAYENPQVSDTQSRTGIYGQWPNSKDVGRRGSGVDPLGQTIRTNYAGIEQVNSEDEEDEMDNNGHDGRPASATGHSSALVGSDVLPNINQSLPPIFYPTSSALRSTMDFAYDFDRATYDGHNQYNGQAQFISDNFPSSGIQPMFDTTIVPNNISSHAMHANESVEPVSRNLSWSSGMTTENQPTQQQYLQPAQAASTGQQTVLPSYLTELGFDSNTLMNTFNHAVNPEMERFPQPLNTGTTTSGYGIPQLSDDLAMPSFDNDHEEFNEFDKFLSNSYHA